MMRSMMFSLATLLAALLAFAAPQKAAAQYRSYPPASQVSPYQPSYNPYQQGPTAQDLAGTWFMSGNQDLPCRILPSRTDAYRALFINERGDQASGTIRGNRITVPNWNLGAWINGDTIRWDNSTMWSR